jgi:hypothetical protein
VAGVAAVAGVAGVAAAAGVAAVAFFLQNKYFLFHFNSIILLPKVLTNGQFHKLFLPRHRCCCKISWSVCLRLVSYLQVRLEPT